MLATKLILFVLTDVCEMKYCVDKMTGDSWRLVRDLIQTTTVIQSKVNLFVYVSFNEIVDLYTSDMEKLLTDIKTDCILFYVEPNRYIIECQGILYLFEYSSGFTPS